MGNDWCGVKHAQSCHYWFVMIRMIRVSLCLYFGDLSHGLLVTEKILSEKSNSLLLSHASSWWGSNDLRNWRGHGDLRSCLNRGVPCSKVWAVTQRFKKRLVTGEREKRGVGLVGNVVLSWSSGVYPTSVALGPCCPGILQEESRQEKNLLLFRLHLSHPFSLSFSIFFPFRQSSAQSVAWDLASYSLRKSHQGKSWLLLSQERLACDSHMAGTVSLEIGGFDSILKDRTRINEWTHAEKMVVLHSVSIAISPFGPM